MTAAVTWKKPPPPVQRTEWTAVSDQLRAHPHKWALVATRTTEKDAIKLTCELRYGKSQGFRKARTVLLEVGAFEVERRGAEVYARFMGSSNADVAQ